MLIVCDFQGGSDRLWTPLVDRDGFRGLDLTAEKPRPPVVDRTRDILAIGDLIEAFLAGFLPASGQRVEPLRISRAIVANADSAGRALEDDQVLSCLGQLRHDLNGGGAGAQNANALVNQLVQGGVRTSPRIFVIPPCTVESTTFEIVDAGN